MYISRFKLFFPAFSAPFFPTSKQHLIAPIPAFAPHQLIFTANHATDYSIDANLVARLWIVLGMAGHGFVRSTMILLSAAARIVIKPSPYAAYPYIFLASLSLLFTA
jgi:hypothetical protein